LKDKYGLNLVVNCLSIVLKELVDKTDRVQTSERPRTCTEMPYNNLTCALIQHGVSTSKTAECQSNLVLYADVSSVLAQILDDVNMIVPHCDVNGRLAGLKIPTEYIHYETINEQRTHTDSPAAAPNFYVTNLQLTRRSSAESNKYEATVKLQKRRGIQTCTDLKACNYK
jgi:hypothetical protein